MADQYVRGPSGLPFKATDEEQARQLIEAGAKAISQEEASTGAKYQQQAQEAENTNPLLKYGAGLAGGLTLGLGPALASMGGLVDPEKLEALQGTSAYKIGDVAGTVLPAIFSGGESALVRGGVEGAELAGRGVLARVLEHTPAGLLQKTGSLAERLAASALPETTGVLGGMARSAATMAARGSAEGALLNLSHTTSEQLLPNHKLAAESLASSFVDGALMGGLLGGGLGATGHLFGEMGRAIANSVNKNPEGRILGRLGANTSEVEGMEAGQGARQAIKDFREHVMEPAGQTFGSKTSDISNIAKKTQKEAETVRSGIIETLDRENPASTPDFNRVAARLQTELPADVAQSAVKSLSKVEAYKPTLPGIGTKSGPWTEWTKARDGIDNVAARNIVDSEIRSAIEGVNQSLGGQYAAAQTKMTVAGQLAKMTGRKASQELLGDIGESKPMFDNSEWARAGILGVTGHPVAAAGYLGAKYVKRAIGGLGDISEPALAEMAYRDQIATEAAASVNNTRAKIAGAMSRFFNGPRVAIQKAMSPDEKRSYTRAGFDKELDRASELVSEAHQRKVVEYAHRLAESGQAELADSMLQLNQRAVAATSANMPPSKKVRQIGSMRAMPTPHGLDLNEYKFLRTQKVLRNPLSVLDKLESGTLGRTEVKELMGTWPELHSEMVSGAQYAMYEAKLNGQTIPVEKITSMSILLDTALDRIVEKDYVDAVQASIQVPLTQPEDANSGPTPQMGATTVSKDLLTPIDKAVIA